MAGNLALLWRAGHRLTPRSARDLREARRNYVNGGNNRRSRMLIRLFVNAQEEGFMQYRAIIDLEATIFSGISSLHFKPDLVIGVPRSGILAGLFASMASGAPLTDIEGFERGEVVFPAHGEVDLFKTRRLSVLVIDDCVNSGISLAKIRARLLPYCDQHDFTFCVAYGPRKHNRYTDIIFEKLAAPHIFEWNVMHHDLLLGAMVDIDEVIFGDAAPDICNAPFRIATKPIGYGVTRLPETMRFRLEEALESWGITVQRIEMLGSNMRETSRAKGECYLRTRSFLYIARSAETAEMVACAAAKPVLSLNRQSITRTLPRTLTQLSAVVASRHLELKAIQSPLVDGWYWKQRARRILGDKLYSNLRRIARRS